MDYKLLSNDDTCQLLLHDKLHKLARLFKVLNLSFIHHSLALMEQIVTVRLLL